MRKQIIFMSLLCLFINVQGQTKKNNLRTRDTITDRAITIPIDMERNFDESLDLWRKTMKASPACNKLVDEDVFYPDSVYIKRLYAFPSDMEMAYNQIVKSYITMYTTRRRSSVSYMLAKGKYYTPIFEGALDKYGIPLELKYLPVIESALNPIAVSRAGATGLWQFMLGTGKMYDLEINSLVDERRDPIKSTDAAAKYLKDLHDIYGDWNLVIAAYNCGPGNVNKAIRRSGGQTDYWAIYPYLPKETRGYVPAFIAATYVMNYYPKHNICPAESTMPMSTDTLQINETIHFAQIAAVLDIPIEDIRVLNPQYKKDIIPGEYKDYTLALPSKKVALFINNKEQILAHQKDELLVHRKVVEPAGTNLKASTAGGASGKTVHRVGKGENLGAIAKKYNVTIDQIKKWNNLSSNRLAIGKKLSINKPVKKEAAESITPEKKVENTVGKIESSNVESLSAKGTKSGIEQNVNLSAQDIAEKTLAERKNYQDTRTIYHKVRIGETMTQIANKYNVANKDIIGWNKLTSNTAKVGQRLIIYMPPQKVEDTKEESEAEQVAVKEIKKETPKAKAQATKIHVVKSGETLSGIAKKYARVTVQDIKNANKLRSDRLSLGQKLKIPQK